MNPYYYYGMCNSSDYLNLQESIKNLINNDSKGLYCPKNIPSKEIYVTNHELEKSFNAPARERVLNYSTEQMEMACPCNSYY